MLVLVLERAGGVPLRKLPEVARVLAKSAPSEARVRQSATIDELRAALTGGARTRARGGAICAADARLAACRTRIVQESLRKELHGRGSASRSAASESDASAAPAEPRVARPPRRSRRRRHRRRCHTHLFDALAGRLDLFLAARRTRQHARIESPTGTAGDTHPVRKSRMSP